MKSTPLNVIALTLLGMNVNLASAQGVVPEVIPYTGYLEMPEPQPREVHLRVELWNQLNGGDVQYCEEHAQVGLYQRRFAINIGQGNTMPCTDGGEAVAFRLDLFSLGAQFLHIKVRLAPEDRWAAVGPRQQFLTVPYAVMAYNGVPAGTILPFAGTDEDVPPGYLLCDGSSYPRSLYPRLFSAIRTHWGTPDGEEAGTHFMVPDLRGHFLRGKGAPNGWRQEHRERNVGTAQQPGTRLPLNKFTGSTPIGGGHSHEYNRTIWPAHVTYQQGGDWVATRDQRDEIQGVIGNGVHNGRRCQTN